MFGVIFKYLKIYREFYKRKLYILFQLYTYDQMRLLVNITYKIDQRIVDSGIKKMRKLSNYLDING